MVLFGNLDLNLNFNMFAVNYLRLVKELDKVNYLWRINCFVYPKFM